ncbi:Hypoxic response protein 1 [subsurface metagenome]
MLKAKDIMTEDVISVKKDTPIYEAVDILAENQIAGIPVVEDDMTLIGILSEKDVLSLLFFYGQDEKRTVNDFMTQPAIHFDKDESLIHVCDCLTNHDFRRVPITSKRKLVGVVSRADIIECIRHLRHENAGASAEESIW